MSDSPSFELPRPQRFTAGTVGDPGRRTFFLQALAEGQLVTLKCEKQQVGALAEHLALLLADLPTVADEDVAGVDTDFVDPAVAQWAVGRMGVAWDESDDRLVLQCEELLIGDADDPEGAEDPDEAPATARFRLTRQQMAAFVDVARRLVESGRPPCELCGAPMDPGGHACPRWN